MIRTYQNADSVVEAVESALNQTLPPFEIVVYDDGSTDGTEDVLRAHRDRIVYLRQENVGSAQAFNEAAKVATGEFVVVLDADDVFEPGRIEALSELAAARPDLDILATDASWESEGRVIGRFNSEANPFEVEDQRAVILDRCFIIAPAVRRIPMLAIGGQDSELEHSSDWDLWMRMILHGSKAGLVDEPLMRYRMRDGSISSNRLQAFATRVEILERLQRNPALRGEDLVPLDRALSRHRQTLALAEAYDAAHRGAPDARALALAVARERAHGRRTRSKAVALAASPSALRPWLVDRLGLAPRPRREAGSSD